jgi:hypothetical protein
MNLSYSYDDDDDDDDDNVAIRLEVVLTPRTVEMNATCTSLACNVTSIRNIVKDLGYSFTSDVYFVANQSP